jgi:hypothetical protein
MSAPEFLSEIEARTALETPQVVLTWGFNDDLVTPMSSGLRWLWNQMVIRRSEFRYPEDPTDGDSILSESFSADPSDSFADVGVSALDEYYYSLFFQYTEHDSSPIDLNQDIKRLGSQVTAVLRDDFETKMDRADGVTVATSTDFDTAGGTFLTDGIVPGDILWVNDGGADDGYYTITHVLSETKIRVSKTGGWAGGASGVDFKIYSGHTKFWISGIDFKRHPVIWRWDSLTQMVDYKIDLSEVLSLDEFVVSLAFVGTISGTKYIAFSTPSRYIRLPVSEEPTVVTLEFDYDSAMDAGFTITGSALLSGTVYALDGVNKVVKTITESTGAPSATKSLVALEGIDAGSVLGLSTDGTNFFVGCKNYVYRVPISGGDPTTDEVERLSFVRDLLDCDFCVFTDLVTSNIYVAITNDRLELFQTYNVEVGREAIWQQPNVADENSVALYHLDESSGDPADSTSHGYDGVNAGMTQAPDSGRFGGAFQATAVGNSVDINALSAAFNGAEGALSLWFKTSDYSTVSGTLARIYVDGNNYIEILFSGGNLQFIYAAGGTVKSVSVASPLADNEYHQYLLVWSSSLDTLEAFFDGAQFGTTQTGLGVWAGAPTVSTIGGGTSTALGFYDEMHVSSIARAVYTKVQIYTDANKMYAYSGRDYDADYAEDDPLGFHYRDEFFTEKFMGGEFIIRNDYEKTKLHPPNKVIEDSEVIFRGPDPLPTLGHTGRLARLLGLMMDRVADSRESALDFFDRYKIDIESMLALAEYLGIPGLDTENWNVDMQQRYIRLMTPIMKRGGRNISYLSMARLLGFIPVDDHLQARRRWDTVHYNATFDSRVQAIPLDTMGSMDTGDEYFPLALLRWRFYHRSFKSTGDTSVAANRLLTDSGASFRDTAEVGAMVYVNDKDDGRDNGKYYITEIHSDTELKVNQDWPQGSLTGLAYSVNFEVPFPDPWIEYLIERFKYLAPACMKTMHRDDSL